MNVSADFSKTIGPMKPVHGFNNASRECGYGPMLEDFIALKPPFVRLHDTCGFYGGAHYVDIPNIFPDFSAPADDPASYDFTLTDLYIKPLVENGIKVMYRLGVTIEHAPKKYHVYPPADFNKWADICEHIVRHYNCGWADGYNWGIEYWEVWNEPDGIQENVEPNGPPMWNGTAQQYYELYSITANRIKSMHPDVKIGGYSSCYITGKFNGSCWEAGDASYFTDFLEYISGHKTKAPLDFFTYHGYLGKNYIGKIETEYTFVKTTLSHYGFTDTEIHDTEWNTNIANGERAKDRTEYYVNMRNHKGASHAAAALFEMQRLGLDGAMFYDAQLWWSYGCLFEVPSLEPTKTYYAFELFSEMYKQGSACEIIADKGVYACAASGRKDILGLANTGESGIEIRLTLKGCHSWKYKIIVTDEEHCKETVAEFNAESGIDFILNPYSFVEIVSA